MACTPIVPPTSTATPINTAQPSPVPTATARGGSVITPLPSPTPSATPSATPLPPLTSVAAPPDLDLLDLGRRLTGKALTGTHPSVDGARVGEIREFWAVDFEKMQTFKVMATLRQTSEHALFYVQNDIAVSEASLEASATALEERIYPRLGAFLGKRWLPPKITILHGRFPQVAGYYSYLDEYPPELFPQSNNRSMIYVNVGALEVGSTHYLGTLTHEIQHAMHWRADPTEDTWLNEGMSENAAMSAGYGASFIKPFLDRPETSLLLWPEQTGATPPAYGAATLFLDFIRYRYLGGRPLAELIAEPADGLESVNRVLAASSPPVTFEQALQEWSVANYLDSRGRPDAYPDMEIQIPDRTVLKPEVPAQRAVEQYGADYLKLEAPAGDYRLTFQGAAVTPLLPVTSAPTDTFWWSNRGDAIDATLTRSFDLRGVRTATLEVDLWYDLEEHWDYVYLVASTDGGKTWTALQTAHTSPDNVVGQALAPGYTGRSGGGKEPAWVTDRVDLTPFVGKDVLIRLEYVTDAAVSLDGMALRRAAVPETGYVWEGQGDGGWQGNGFVRTPNQARQTYWVKLVRFPSTGPAEVEDILLDATGSGSAMLRGLGKDVRAASVIIIAAAPGTSQPALYTLTLQPGP